MSTEGQNQGNQLTIADYQEVIDNQKQLVKELDVFLNGSKAATQANLADIIKQLKSETQNIWIVKDAADEPVMMCPTKPDDETIFKLQETIHQKVSVNEFLLFKK